MIFFRQKATAWKKNTKLTSTLMQILTIPQRGNKKELSGKSTSSTPVALTSCLCLSTSGLTEAIEPLPRCSKVSICILFFYYTVVLGFSLSSSSLDLFSDSLLIMGVTGRRQIFFFLFITDLRSLGARGLLLGKITILFLRDHGISAECNVGRVSVYVCASQVDRCCFGCYSRRPLVSHLLLCFCSQPQIDRAPIGLNDSPIWKC